MVGKERERLLLYTGNFTREALKRKFFTNLILLLTVNLLIKPFWLLGIDRKVQIVTGDDYGLYGALLSLSIALNVLLDLGITNYNNRNIARYSHLLPKHLGNILGLKIMLLVVYAIVCLGWGAIVGYNKVQFHILFFLIFNQFLLQLILYLRSNLSALHLFTTDSLASVLDRVFMIVLCGLLLYTNISDGVFKIEWFVYIQTLSYLLAASFIFIVVYLKAGSMRLRFNLKFNIVFLKKTYPYAVLVLLMAFYNRFDLVILERLLPQDGVRQVALYLHGFRLLDAVSMFGVLFAGMLLPIFSRMIKQKQNLGEMVKFAFSLIIFISITVAFTSHYYQLDIMNWMDYDHVQESAPIFSVLMFCFIPISTTYIFGTLLTANGSLRQLNIMAAFGVMLNIVLNLIVIPNMMALGAAYVALLTQSVTALAQVFIAAYIFRFRINWKIASQIVLFALLVAILGNLSRLIVNPILGVFSMLVSATVVAFAIRLINLKALIDMVLNRD